MLKNKSFGEASAEKFNIGDIVEWSSWNEGSECWNYNYGIVTEIKNEVRTNRMVSISKVLPLSGERTEIEHFSVSLRLVSKGLEDSRVKH
jgi:hypothetical protein|tara:strand:- start:1232 stop:1501 length:270 start_codon:yes stop_codon:yes gene_type:complete